MIYILVLGLILLLVGLYSLYKEERRIEKFVTYCYHNRPYQKEIHTPLGHESDWGYIYSRNSSFGIGFMGIVDLLD